MPSMRLRGQELSLIMVQAGQPIAAAALTKDSSFEAMLEILQEGYTGMTTDMFDEIFKGFQGDLNLHTQDESIFDMQDSIIQRATRQNPAVQFNLKATLTYPNGDRPRLIFTDLYFGPLPFKNPGRAQFLAATLNWKCSNYQRIG